MDLIKWDSNGMVLKKSLKQSTLVGGFIDVNNSMSMALKPVFWEELQLLGFDKFWDIPKVDGPLLWYNVKSRCYYYRGKVVARHRGGNVITSPEIELYDEDIVLDENLIFKDISRNKDLLVSLEEEAIKFIRDTSKNYENVVVSFSGGKDSLVVLYLTLKALGDLDKSFQVLYVDTTLESKYTLDLINEVKKYLGLKDIEFNIVYPKKKAYDMMVEVGVPTRLNRWCCKRLKLYPIERFYYKLDGFKNRVLSLEGLRKEESVRRSKYKRIEVDKVIMRETKGHPILEWSSLELWLYLLFRNLPVHKLYRFGLNRVSCIFCPFHRGWMEYILKNVEDTGKYWSLLKKQVEYIGVEDVCEYICGGFWKARYSFMDKKVNVMNKNNKNILGEML